MNTNGLTSDVKIQTRIALEQARLDAMRGREEYTQVSYQAGVVTGLGIAQRLLVDCRATYTHPALTPVAIDQAMLSLQTGGADAWLICPGCEAGYRLGNDPTGLAFGPNGATVLPGHVETCPRCWHESAAGAVLAVELDLEEAA